MYVLRCPAPKTEWPSSLLHKQSILSKEWWSNGGLRTKPSTQTFFLLVEKFNGSRLVCLIPHHKVPAVIPEAVDSWRQRCVMKSALHSSRQPWLEPPHTRKAARTDSTYNCQETPFFKFCFALRFQKGFLLSFNCFLLWISISYSMRVHCLVLKVTCLQKSHLYSLHGTLSIKYHHTNYWTVSHAVWSLRPCCSSIVPPSSLLYCLRRKYF